MRKRFLMDPSFFIIFLFPATTDVMFIHSDSNGQLFSFHIIIILHHDWGIMTKHEFVLTLGIF